MAWKPHRTGLQQFGQSSNYKRTVSLNLLERQIEIIGIVKTCTRCFATDSSKRVKKIEEIINI